MSRFRAIFFGSPAFAVPCLEALHEVADVLCVISQPDRPAGRGLSLAPPQVKVRAQDLGLMVEQPLKVRTPEFARKLQALEADVGVVVAYGRILPRAVLDAPSLGCVNVHASLLPRWRGAAPIQWAVTSGDPETGVCLMCMDEGLDTGPVLSCERTEIGVQEQAGEVAERVSRLGAELLRRDLPRFVSGELIPRPQDESRVTHAPILTKAHGRIDWTRPSRAVHDLIRGMQPWPGAHTLLEGTSIKIHRAHVGAEDGQLAAPGTLVRVGGGILEVACGEGSLLIDALQLPGRRRLTAQEFLSGHAWPKGSRFDPSFEEST